MRTAPFRLAVLAASAALTALAPRAQIALPISATNGQATGTLVAPGGTVTFAGFADSRADFDPGPGNESSTGRTGFVARYGPDGAFQWKWAENNGFDYATVEGIAERAGGGVSAVGQLRGTVDADPGAGTETVFASDGMLLFALDASGGLDWAVAIDGDARVFPQDVASDAAGNLYVTGWIGAAFGTNTVDFDPGAGTAELYTNDLDLFVASYTASGAFRWAFDVGRDDTAQARQVRGYAVDVDDSGLLVGGSFFNTQDFDPGPGTTTVSTAGSGGADGFVARYTYDGDFVWVSRFGGASANDVAYGLDATGDGGALVAGKFDPGPGPPPELYLARFGPNGTVAWSHTLGGSGASFGTEALDVALVGDQAVFVGRFDSEWDTDPGPGTATLAFPAGASGTYGFIAGYDAATGDYLDAMRIGEGSPTLVSSIARGTQPEASVVVGGVFYDRVEFPGGSELETMFGTERYPFVAGFVFGPVPPLSLTVTEQIGVMDEVSFLEALALLVQERIGVVDEANVLRALLLAVQETIGARDGLGLVTPGSIYASVFVSVPGEYTLDETDITLTLNEVVGMGDIAILQLVGGDGLTVGTLDDRWILAVDDALSFSETSAVRIALRDLPPDVDPAALAVAFRPVDGEFGDLPTTYDAETGEIVATGVTGSGEFSVAARPVAAEDAIPETFALHPPSPNPTAGDATIRFDLPTPTDARVSVYDALGREAAVLHDGPLGAASHTRQIRSGTLAPGVYVVQLRAGDRADVRRLTVVR